MKEKELIDYNHGDISIKKVSNGWIVLEGSQHHEDTIMFSAYESEESQYLDNMSNATLGDAKSLQRLLEDVFEGYLRCKKWGGITIQFHERGYEPLDDEEQ